MKRTPRFMLCLILIALQHGTMGIDLTKINLAYLYDINAPVKLSYRLIQGDTSVIAFVDTKVDTIGIWNLGILAQQGFESETHDTLKGFQVDTLQLIDSRYLLQVTLSDIGDYNMLVLALTNDRLSGYYYFDVPISQQVGLPEIFPVNEKMLPIVQSHYSGDVSFFGKTKDSLHVYEYAPVMEGCDPPMGQMKPLAPTLDIDTSFYFSKIFDQGSIGHFYLFQNDLSDDQGITLLHTPPYYPEVKRIEELIGPMQYITTETENKALNNRIDTKGVFEKFWINTYGTKFRAKGAIRTFFGSVRESNQLFTDYREGWKTDRGMLYIVFGKPEVVIRSNNLEVWKYTGGIEFEFIRISTLFAPSFYSLKRDKKYEDIWYNKVGELRQG